MPAAPGKVLGTARGTVPARSELPGVPRADCRGLCRAGGCAGFSRGSLPVRDVLGFTQRWFLAFLGLLVWKVFGSQGWCREAALGPFVLKDEGTSQVRFHPCSLCLGMEPLLCPGTSHLGSLTPLCRARVNLC